MTFPTTLLLLVSISAVLVSCAGKAPAPVDPKTINLVPSSGSSSRSATPPHRLNKYEYPFDSRGNYVASWAAEGERRAGRSPVKTTRSYSSSRSSRTTSSSRPSSSAVYYTVRSGDTLSAISRRYGTSISALKSRNGLRSDLIRIGQRLRIK